MTKYYTLTYDAENHLTGVSGAASANFVYDGDGKRVKATFGDSTIAYVEDYFEWKGSTSTMVKYYYANGQRIAMRVGSTTRYYLLTDHLGSTAITANSSGTRVAELRYYAYGDTRYTYGTTPTTYRFTGQRLDESTGLMYYGARYYDPALGRFVQADTIVPEPGNPQALNRYSYVLNNPLRYVDPSGHDLMIVGGYDNPNWEDPTQWKAWIMTYKGWTTEEQWSTFFEDWRKADDAGRQRIMQETGVHIFNWAGFAAGVDPRAASRSASVEDTLAELSQQMAGMKDITLIGHSKGGNLVLNYVQKMAEGGYTQPKNAALVDALLQPELIPLFGGMSPEKGFLGRPTVAGSGAKVVNLYNPLDPVNDSSAGTVWGAENILALSLDVHSTKPSWANSVLNDGLQVQFDHGASRWPYLPVIMK